MKNLSLHEPLRNIAHQYPIDMVEDQLEDISRISFNICLALDAATHKPLNNLEICDLGGGVGMFSIGCAAIGLKRVVLVDDFDDPVNHRIGASILDLHRSLGVEVDSRDVIEKGIQDLDGSFDIITTFDSMEHWHHSPKNLFHEVVNKLNPGGIFVLGVPNCVNLRKRLSTLLGIGKWSGMHDWYEINKFRGHVREPDVNDLLYIARDMGLADIKIFGRNWLGHRSASQLIRLATKIIDHPLRILPSLCSDIYLVGRKAQSK